LDTALSSGLKKFVGYHSGYVFVVRDYLVNIQHIIACIPKNKDGHGLFTLNNLAKIMHSLC
jgi:hypothetical protein